MIEPKQIPQLVKILINYDWFEIRARFQMVVNEVPATVIPSNADRRGEIESLITHAYKKRKIGQFLEALGDLGSEVGTFVGAGAPCPTTTLFVLGTMPFIDRRSLRETLRELTEQDNLVKVVVVRGPEASGKSYSGHLIAHVANRKAGSRIVWVRLTEIEPNFEFEPSDLMVAIASQLSLTVPKNLSKTRTQDARIVQKLLDWLVGAFPKYPDLFQPVWLILDDLNFTGCPLWVAEFAAGLAARVTRTQLPDLNLFLIGIEPERLPLETRFITLTDNAVPPTPDELWSFLLQASARSAKPLKPEQKDGVIPEIWGTKPPPLRHEDIVGIAIRAGAYIQKLSGGRGA
jgi:hypothetical protein